MEPLKQERQTEGLLSWQEAQGRRQSLTQMDELLELGWYPEIQIAHAPLKQEVHLSGQDTQDPLINCSPWLHEVQTVTSLGEQLEQVITQLLHFAPTGTKPPLQLVQVLFVQLRQFL
jgi:hypothetical protein